MLFFKTGTIYQIIRVTGCQDNILGISFLEPNSSEGNLEIIEWNFRNINTSKRKTSKEEVLNQVLSGLEFVNKSLGTNYKLSKIYFSPFDISANQVYSGLISILIKHYHSGNKFREV